METHKVKTVPKEPTGRETAENPVEYEAPTQKPTGDNSKRAGAPNTRWPEGHGNIGEQSEPDV